VDLVSTGEVASMFGVTPRTIQLWAENGLLTSTRTAGGHRRFNRAEVEALFKEWQQQRNREGTAHNPCVLIIDDDMALQELYRRQIERLLPNAQVHSAGDGYRGLVKIGLLKPDLVLLDLVMPGLDGIRVLREVQSNPDLQRTNVVVVTGLSDEDIADRGGLPPGIRHLRKPVTISDMQSLFSGLYEPVRGTGT